ncbi:MAG TPA: glycosyltransferase [Mycobacteriales bacterium]|nr:glycosyltransferase [Mycobacteriales bacterium]
MHEPFALLLPVFAGDRPNHFDRAFRSSAHDQFLPPDQVVLVQDGPVDDELASCITHLRETSPVPVTYLRLDDNVGLGPALDAGLEASQYDVVARMDADDVSMPWRFQVQLPLIESADIVGAGLLEFTDDIDHVVGRRIPPVEAAVIREYARLHDPFNHPTVVYRRQAVQAAGGYGRLARMEDYWLFARMLADGAEPVNVAEPLVYYRVGGGAYQRRGGAGMLRAEAVLQREMRRAGITSGPEYARNLAVRGGYRLVPWRLRRGLYTSLVATRFEPAVEPMPVVSREPAFGLAG